MKPDQIIPAANENCLFGTDDPLRPFWDIYESAILDVVEYYASERPRASIGSQGKFENKLVAVIGFGGDTVRGSSALIAGKSVIRALAGDAAIDPNDWLGELNNQVVGRLKNQLTRRGVPTHVGTPVTISADEFHLSVVGVEPTLWQIDWNSGEILGVLAIECAETLDLDVDENLDVALEGSVSLF